MALTLSWIGLVLTLAGTVCAAVAFVKTWGDLRPDQPLVPMPRWLGGKRNVTVQGGSASGTISISSSARGWASIAETASVDKQIAYLRGAVLTLDRAIGAEAAQSAKRDGELTAQIAQVQTSLGQSVVDLREHTTRVSTGTIRLQLLGLILVGAGALVGVLPIVFRIT